MSLIAEFCVSSTGLVLHDARTRVPSVSVDVEQELALDPRRPFLFFWARVDATADARRDHLVAFREALRDDASVTDEVVLDSLSDRWLYRVQFTADHGTVLYPEYVELGAALLDLTGDADGWHTEMRFPDRDALGTFREFCAAAGVTFDLERIYEGTARDTDDALTDRQRAAVEAALSLGYFRVPRDATLSDVAERLGISTQAASERLRRGIERLARDAV